MLNQEYDFHALAEPLKALGLTRLHLTGACNYTGLPQLNVSNHVVISLNNFRSQIQEPSTFVNRWLTILCLPCQNLTPKQLKIRVEKVVQNAKKFSKKGDTDGLKLFQESFFLEENPVSLPDEQTCKGCDSLKQSSKSKDVLIKDLQKQNEEYSNELTDLKLISNILEEEVKSKSIAQEEMVSVSVERKEMKRKNSQLKLENKDLQTEIKVLQNKSRTYKENTYLRKENQALGRQVNHLEQQVSDLKTTTSFQSLSELKRKVDNEQALKSKWKRKYKDLEDSLIDVTEEPEQDESLTNLRESRHNKFTSDVRLTYMALQGEADIPASKCSKVVDIVSRHLHGKKLKGLPCTSSVLNMADEGHHVAKQQIADKILSSKHFTLSSDGTSRQKQHYMERHITLDDGTMLNLGFSEIASDDAKSMLEHAIEILDEITHVHCSSSYPTDDNYQDKVNETLIEILKRLKSLMSDRAANMKAFDELFHNYKREILGPDDASTIFLFCNAHFLLGLSAGTEKVLRLIEDELSEPGNSFGGPFLFFNEQASLALIRCAADVFGPRGDEKNGCRQEWLSYCELKNISSSFSNFRSNRFNNIFENACALIIHKDNILDFLQNFSTIKNKKLSSVQDAVQNSKILGTVLAVGILNKLITKPYWDLMRSKEPYSSFPPYVRLMDAAFQRWSLISDSGEIGRLEAAFDSSQSKSKTITIDFLAELDSGDYCRETFQKTFSAVVTEMKDVLRRQLSEFLQDGVFAGDIPDDIKSILDKCPLTNLTGEGLFGDFDYDINKRRHSSTHHRSTLNMWKHNQTAAWLQKKSGKEKDRILTSAHKCGRSLRQEHKEAVKREKLKVLKKIEENEKKRNEKEMVTLVQKNKVLDEILKKGLCQSEEDLMEMWRRGTVEDLKNQIRYRKIFMNDKSLTLKGSKRELLDALLNCIMPID